MRAQGVSLWLVPDGPEAQATAALIGELSARFGTPTFAPHVTLLGGLAVDPETAVTTAGDLAAGLTDLSVRFEGLEHSGDYFRALVVRRAQAAFPSEPVGPFVPHLSLLYGAVPVETRRHLAAEVRESAPAAIVMRHLDVVATEGAVAQWRRLARLPLSGPAGAHPTER